MPADMTMVHSLIEAIIALPVVTTDHVGAITGTRIALDRESPYARFYNGAGGGRLRRVRLTLSKTGPGWSVDLEFNIDDPYFEHELELHRYDGVPDIVGIYPEATPEGQIALGCKHAGFGLYFRFTSTTRRLASLSIARPKPPTANPAAGR
jgi:hypothetical protein